MRTDLGGSACLLEIIQVEPEVVDRHFGRLIGLVGQPGRDAVVQLGASKRRGLGGRRIGGVAADVRRVETGPVEKILVTEIHQLRFDGGRIVRRHFARRRLIGAALRRVESEIEVIARVQSRTRRRADGRQLIPLRRQIVIQAALAIRVAEQIDVHAVLAALQIQIDHRSGTASAAGRGAEHRLVRADLFAHDDDLVPLAGRRAVARRFQSFGRLQERVLVAPDEVDFQ